jgi:hypothetical protein
VSRRSGQRIVNYQMTKRNDLREGQLWDVIGSPVVNAETRLIRTLGTKSLTYRTEMGRERTVLISSFLRWARIAECKSLEKSS